MAYYGSQSRYHNEHIPEAYERLLLDAIHGDQQHFVRRWPPPPAPAASSAALCLLPSP